MTILPHALKPNAKMTFQCLALKALSKIVEFKIQGGGGGVSEKIRIGILCELSA